MSERGTARQEGRGHEGADQRVLPRMLRTEPSAQNLSAPDKAIAAALIRAAMKSVGLQLEVSSLQESILSLAELPEVIEDCALRLVIEGPKGVTGLVVLGPQMVTALMQMQTLGRLCRVGATSRRPTRTDAALLAEFTDSWLSAIDQDMAASADRIWAGGFRYVSWIEESRTVASLLEDISYRVWRIELMLGEGRASMLWVVPEDGQGMLPIPEAEPQQQMPDIAWTEGFQRSVLGAEARLDAVIYRMTLPLATVLAFRAGLDVPLPEKAISQMWVEASGRRLCTARLGQRDGRRAVLLSGLEGDADTSEASSSEGFNMTENAYEPEPPGSNHSSHEMLGT